MKRLVLISFLLYSIFLFVPSFSYASMLEYIADSWTQIGKDVQLLKEEMMTLFAAGVTKTDAKSNADKIIGGIGSIVDKITSIKNDCELMESMDRYGTNYSWCHGYFRVYASETADIFLKVGDYCVKNSLFEDARNIYRRIIINYTGIAYKSYVRQAEFGLEDIRTLEEKERVEKEKLEQAKKEEEAKKLQEQQKAKALKKRKGNP